jgi:hypothetical protein
MIAIGALALLYLGAATYLCDAAFNKGGWEALAGLILFFVTAPAVIYGLRRRQLEDER